MRFDRRTGVLAAIVLWAFGLIVTSAQGDNYGDGDGSAGLKPDNSEHTFCLSAEFDGQDAVNAALNKMDNLQEQTTMTKNRFPSCGSGIDAKFHYANLGDGIDGKWVCETRSGNYCLEALLRFDRSHINYENNWQQTACHEIGHSVGLAHGEENDCMGGRHDEYRFRIYNDHHRQHINQDR